MYSNQDLDDLAFSVLMNIDQFLSEKLVYSILETYKDFFKRDTARRLHISELPITSEIRIRLRFECLCFSTFMVSLQSSNYFMEKRWLFKKRDLVLIKQFDGSIAVALIQLCKNFGIRDLREIIIIEIDPKPKFGLGEPLDPLKRLEEYISAFKRERGSEIELLGKWIGRTLDAYHPLIFEIIGASFGKSLLELSALSMDYVFNQ